MLGNWFGGKILGAIFEFVRHYNKGLRCSSVSNTLSCRADNYPSMLCTIETKVAIRALLPRFLMKKHAAKQNPIF